MPHNKEDILDKKTLSLVKRLIREYLRPYLGQLGVAFLFMAVAAAMTAGIAQLMQPVLDDVLSADGRGNNVWLIATMVFGVFFVRGIATYLHTIIMNKIGQSIVADIQKSLFDKFMGMDLAFFHANPSGQLISRVINDVNVMRVAVSDSLTGLGKSTLTLIFLIAVMFYQDWKLSIAAFIIFPFAAGFVSYLGRKLRKVSGDIQDEMAGLSDILSQIFHGIRQVKAYGMEAYESKRCGQAIDSVKKLNIKSVRVGNLSTPVNEILVGLVLMGVIGYGGMQVASGAMTAGQLGAFMAAFIMAYEPMKKLAKLNNALQMGLGAAERVFALMDRDIRIQDSDNALDLNVKAPEIAFSKVNFQYQEADDKALNSISFIALPGKVTALVGPSGGGKSTIINLIPRFYDVSGGKITINGHDLRDLSLKSLRSHMALVSQDITIFDDTVLSNIRYSKPEASESEVIEAAKMAAAHEFIEGMPDGYQTILGEDGVRLSGGQKQRIAIARAILRDAPILLLDEATSALDNESEQLVQKALKELEKGRTTIVIAHRLSTVQNADQIIVLDKGQIVETGKHDELIKKKGVYASMYQAGL
ncbi:MAG: ABC transporter ATP-binding protein [Alphaproteobacteria bacterium]